MNVKNLSIVNVDGMVQFLKIEDSDDTSMLVNLDKISTITEKLNGDIEISINQEDRIVLKDTSLSELTEVLEDSEYCENDWDEL